MYFEWTITKRLLYNLRSVQHVAIVVHLGIDEFAIRTALVFKDQQMFGPETGQL